VRSPAGSAANSSRCYPPRAKVSLWLAELRSLPMHVALDALFLDPGVSGGPETVLRGLLPALRGTRPGARVTVVTTRRGAKALRADGWEGVVALRCDEGERVARLLAEQVALPRWCVRHGVDVLHSIASMAPVRARVPHVVTVHDVTFMHLPTFGRMTTVAMTQSISRAARAADALTSGSAAARDDVAATLGLAPEAFTVIHHGIDRTVAAAPVPAGEVRARFELPAGAPVVLCVATKRRHKNQELLLRAVPALPADALLVLAGHPEQPYDGELRALAAQLGVSGRVRFADYVSDGELGALWEIAGAAAFPTRAEGFGLPVLEALAHGVPVACSDIAVLREVGGTHVRTFDPDDPAGCAAAIAACLREPWDGGGARAHAGAFTWRAAAERYWAVYDGVRT
jgi:glycosyltransferase involved in cell wall biosynthesis